VVRRAILAILLLVPLVALGCGKSTAEKRKEFFTEARGICGHFSRLQNDVRFPEGNPLSAKMTHVSRAQWGLALNQIVNYGRQEVRGLRKLKPPKDIRDKFEQLLDTKDAAFTDLAEGADAAKRNRISEIKVPVTAGRAKLAQATKLAKDVDLPVCG
jgi:hypothetical protein